MITRDAVIAEARTWIATPFHHGQSVRGIGCDCIGFITGVADALGLREARTWRNDPRFRNYSSQPNPAMLRAACGEYLDAIAFDDARPGDILLFAFMCLPMHFGILSRHDPRYVLHCYQPRGRVVENVIDAKWGRRIVGAFALRGVA